MQPGSKTPRHLAAWLRLLVVVWLAGLVGTVPAGEIALQGSDIRDQADHLAAATSTARPRLVLHGTHYHVVAGPHRTAAFTTDAPRLIPVEVAETETTDEDGPARIEPRADLVDDGRSRRMLPVRSATYPSLARSSGAPRAPPTVLRQA